jgi:hypothetical protein
VPPTKPVATGFPGPRERERAERFCCRSRGAAVCVAAQDLAHAVALYEQVITVDPAHAEAHYIRSAAGPLDRAIGAAPENRTKAPEIFGKVRLTDVEAAVACSILAP